MIVCVCHAVSDRTIRTATASGLTLEEVRQQTGLGSSCGQCLATFERLGKGDGSAESVQVRSACASRRCQPTGG